MSSAACPFLLDREAFSALCEDFIAQQPQIRKAKSKQPYRLAPFAFRRWMLDQGYDSLNEDVVKAWILHRASRATAQFVAFETSIISRFVDFTVSRDLWLGNPWRDLRLKHRAKGMRGIVRHVDGTGSIAGLDALADIPFSGSLAPHFRRYLEQLRGLGIGGGSHELYLASFERFLRQCHVSDLASIDQPLIEEWSRWPRSTTARNRRYRLVILSKFFDFLVSHEILVCSPVPDLQPHRYRPLPPHIYSLDEVRRVLEAAAVLPDHWHLPHRGPMYRTLFLTLYTLGLRRSEALELRLNDIDFDRRSLTIREGKFRKGRVLPFGPKYGAALREYIATHPLLRNAPSDAYLFPTPSLRTPRLSSKSAAQNLAQILDALNIVSLEGIRPPGLHSFRHSFAVHRVERWHRDGADLRVKLPLLSAFLGHQKIAATQIYLTMTPERLRLVGEVFERMFGIAADSRERDS